MTTAMDILPFPVAQVPRTFREKPPRPRQQVEPKIALSQLDSMEVVELLELSQRLLALTRTQASAELTRGWKG